MELWKRIAQEHLARANPAVAKAVADLVKEEIKPLLEQLNPDFGHDALSTGLRGMSEGSISFPARPAVFDSENLNGNLLVKLTLDPPVSGTGPAIAGSATTAVFTVGYYFKTPKLPGGGKFMWETSAGQAEVEFDEQGNPMIVDSGDLVDLVDAMEKLAERVVDDPPEGARSYTRDPELRKQQRELNQQSEQSRKEKEREDAQSKAEKERRDADAHTHGSVEAFIQYMDDIDEDVFGPADLQKLLNTMYKDPTSRAVAQGEIRKQLVDEGLEWNPGKRTLSFRLDLLKVAARLAAS